ncbi:MAG: MFS transporter [Methanotrichaceae archaeon]|nr:MFS transporter [Methanotrichaceae archaeon]
MPTYANDETKRYALIIAAFASFIPPFMSSSINIALPAISEDFAMDAIMLGWIATSYLLAAAVFMVPFGRLADIHGMKKLFIYGLAIYTVSSLLAFLAPYSAFLIATRVLQGIGSAMVFGSGTAILVNVFPLGERGKVLGINAAFVYLGLSLGPFIGGLLTQYMGWRSLFLINVPMAFIPLALTIWKLEGEWADAHGEIFDLVGSVIYSLMLISIMYGFSQLPDFEGIIMFLAGAIAFLVLIKWESKVECPILDVNLFRYNHVYAFSNLASLINYSATFGVGFLLSLYLQYIKGLEPNQAGLVLLMQPLVMTLFSPYSGRLSDRIEPRIVATAGMSITFASVLMLAFISWDTGIIMIALALLFLGIGLAFFISPNTNAIMSSIDRKHYGVGSATLGTVRLVGQVTSMGIVMMVFSIILGRLEIIPEYYPLFLQSTKVAFAIFSVLCFIGIFASLARGPLRKADQTNINK